jgi:putative transcriptional regulator
MEQLLTSVNQSAEAAAVLPRTVEPFRITAGAIKEMRARTRLSQPDFAILLGVELSTLRNWEQGRREPTGPAKALLRAIHNDPASVIRALAHAAA